MCELLKSVIPHSEAPDLFRNANFMYRPPAVLCLFVLLVETQPKTEDPFTCMVGNQGNHTLKAKWKVAKRALIQC